MANTVLEVGTGVFVIVAVWIVALVFGILLLRAPGSAKLGVLPVFLLALTITLVLVFFPRSPETPLPFKDIEIVDTLFIGRYVLLAVVSTIFLVAFFVLLPFHFLEPVYAKPLKTH
ncbi:transmembrane protein 218 [Maylandia zebra]|uniref:Transmembrane protein 218 n=4 Tax=Haplochromini TaxID=319058 RepID=A0A3Q2W4W8_HAPBU|nr:transmembrane protein 218 [Maylandia zebra]XP_005740155.1 PREDICTED: transmembrane protein 218 [Pundamilia nyererei]XP_005943412.1 transmembrane protein 218 [Haplochromis burtoni]XP_026038987.1 transmembrane protein 218 [Astatotilapia calliptera]XP_042084809.1 transmembrane protein 218 [Haplochromis burtoni]